MVFKEFKGNKVEGTKENESKPFDPVKKRLEWLALAKVGDELIGRNAADRGLGFKEHLGYGTTDIIIKGIKAENLRIYEKDGIYYITTKDRASLEAKYGVKNLNDVDLGKVIDDLEQRPNFDKIKWDLPKIHAIKTMETTNEWFDENEKSIMILTKDKKS